MNTLRDHYEGTPYDLTKAPHCQHPTPSFEIRSWGWRKSARANTSIRSTHLDRRFEIIDQVVEDDIDDGGGGGGAPDCPGLGALEFSSLGFEDLRV